uniref:Uncharacterized protein n=1 Tax=Siphoviridae sp. ctiV651 TaxID=2827917 RepID=A0A8S5S5G9_9CAUD|nr:MAG TPA: hypothetical protein [Siphoviridae sp. ctiV651]
MLVTARKVKSRNGGYLGTGASPQYHVIRQHQ